MTDTVLVTGGSGFLAGHVIRRLLDQGYRVRTTLRSLDRESEVRTWIGRDTRELTFVAADLTSDDGWPAAVTGCDYVLHVASPFPLQQPNNEDDLIKPARDGTLRVLRAAAAAGVRRVVVTSSFAAIGYSPKPSGLPYDESDWTDASGQQSPYVKSKTLAERAAWDFAAQHPDGPELTVINPVGIFGPVLGGDYASSVGIIQILLDGKLPLVPRSSFAIVDVRDVADLHATAMVSPRAAGERFLAAAGQPVTLPEVARILRSRLGDGATRVPNREAPDWLVRAAARFVPPLEGLAALLGEPKLISTAKATDVLGWQPRPTADTVADTGESLLELRAVSRETTPRERAHLHGNHRRVACRRARSR
jgi:dihydroflavonol-4-reductase